MSQLNQFLLMMVHFDLFFWENFLRADFIEACVDCKTEKKILYLKIIQVEQAQFLKSFNKSFTWKN